MFRFSKGNDYFKAKICRLWFGEFGVEMMELVLELKVNQG